MDEPSSSPLHVFILLLVVSIYAAGILVIQLKTLLAGRGFTVLRHHKIVFKIACLRITGTMGSSLRGMEKTKTMSRERAPPIGQRVRAQNSTPKVQAQLLLFKSLSTQTLCADFMREHKQNPDADLVCSDLFNFIQSHRLATIQNTFVFCNAHLRPLGSFRRLICRVNIFGAPT